MGTARRDGPQGRRPAAATATTSGGTSRRSSSRSGSRPRSATPKPKRSGSGGRPWSTTGRRCREVADDDTFWNGTRSSWPSASSRTRGSASGRYLRAAGAVRRRDARAPGRRGEAAGRGRRLRARCRTLGRTPSATARPRCEAVRHAGDRPPGRRWWRARLQRRTAAVSIAACLSNADREAARWDQSRRGRGDRRRRLGAVRVHADRGHLVVRCRKRRSSALAPGRARADPAAIRSAHRGQGDRRAARCRPATVAAQRVRTVRRRWPPARSAATSSSSTSPSATTAASEADTPGAVNDLSLTVPAGKICVLVGPSGCGKTTSLKMVNRLIEPTSGRILLDGADVATRDVTELRRGIGYVIQQVGLFPHQTIGENVVDRARGCSAGTRRAGASGPRSCWTWSASTRPRYRDRYPSQLSGGERQRVGRGAGARRRSAGDAHGRAVRRRRPDRPRAPPGRAPAPPGGAGQDDPVRDPRHRRGDQDGRPRRGPPGRRASSPSSARRPRSWPPRPRSSWPASWAPTVGSSGCRLSRVGDLALPMPAMAAPPATTPPRRAAGPRRRPRPGCSSLDAGGSADRLDPRVKKYPRAAC